MNGAQMLPPINSQQYNNMSNNNNPNQNHNYYIPKQYIKTIPLAVAANNNGFVLSNSIKKNIIPNSMPILQTKNGNQSVPAVVASEQWSKPRLITIIRATDRPRKKITILLNRKALHNFEQFVCDISDAFGLPQWKNDKIRKLYSIKGKRVQGISEFFRDEDVFIGVSGKEPLKGHLIKDLIQELYPDNEEVAQSIFREWETSRSKSRATRNRHNSVDHTGGATSQGNTHRDMQDRDKSPTSNKNNYEFDENGRRKRKKKIGENEAVVDYEAQRQRERLKLIELERKKRELIALSKFNDSKEPNANASVSNSRNNGPVKRVNIVTPPIDNNNNEQAQLLEMKKLKRKPKFKKSQNNILDELTENNKHSKTPNEEVINTPRRSVNNNSKSPGVPKDLENKENKELEMRSTPNNLNLSMHEKQNQTRKSSQATVKKDDYVSNKIRRQISNVSHVTDKYEFIKTLGDGNFAIVKQAKLKNTENEYAIKIIDKSKMKGKENMIENEIYIMKSCNHQNIVKLHEEFETKTEVYLVTDLVKGGDLFDAISQSVKFNEKESALMVQDLCEALFYLHSKKIVHRDLKPENLLVMRKKDDKISIKLADFGLAMEVKEPIYTVCGTPTYVAPEILSEIGYGLEVDMWACGVITYILLCGFPPFRSLDRNQEELFQYIQAGEFEYLMPYWEGISESSKDLINHLLVVDIKKRWKAEDVLCHPWIITQGNSKPMPANYEEYKKNYLNELRAKAKVYAAEPFATRY